MKFSRNKAKVTTISLVLVLTISAILVAFPTVGAHDPPRTKDSWAYVAVSPNPIGQGQNVFVTFWLDTLPQTANGAYGDRYTWTVEVTKPDGSKETLGPITSDPVGSGYALYIPDQVGTYTFQSFFPGHTYTGEPAPPQPWDPYITSNMAYVNDTLNPSESDIVELTVQADPVMGTEDVPLPTEYWTRPIEGENREWYKIGGNWLAAGEQDVPGFAEYTTAPKTAHIMWTRPYWFGGVVGGEVPNGQIPYYYDGLSYERLWRTAIIINGILYYSVDTPPRYGYYAIDIRTGEELWFQNSTGPLQATGSGGGGTWGSGDYVKLSFGQILEYDCPNQHGAFAYLWANYGSTWQMYDAWTGNWICNIENVPGGSAAYGPIGSILRYQYNNKGYLSLWNSTQAIWYHEEFSGNNYWTWRPFMGETFDGNNGYSWNATAPVGLGSIFAVLGDRLLGQSGMGSYDYGTNAYSIWCLNLEQGHEGELMWKKDYASPPTQNATVTPGPVSVEDGIFTIAIKETREWYAYDLDTGEYVWGPTESMNAYDMYSMRRGTGTGIIVYGKLLAYGYSGVLYCFDASTGQLLWTEPTESGFDSYYDEGRFPLSLGFVADGKIYLYSTEHSASKPLWRGSKLRCINIESGETLWATDHWGNHPAIGDGYIVDLNNYDGQIYCYGKGPSATTVTASPKVVAKGTGVLIEGMVTDVSAGAKSVEARFPNGLPAIADVDMTEWMDYVYKQKPMPMDASGVSVTLDAIAPDGSFINIGRVTSDMSGMFKKMWTPDTEGEYTIIATFEGSDSYFSSYAETAVGVGSALAPIQPIEPEEPAEAPFITTEIAIIIAVVVVAIIGVVAFWALRKRK